MIRKAQPGEEAAIEAFLAQHADSSMFLRSNLAAYGLAELQHPHGTTYCLYPEIGAIRGVFGRSNSGFLMCQAPDAAPEVWRGFADALEGQEIKGMTGDDEQVTAALAAIGLPGDGFVMNHAEPLYRLDLARLKAPAATLRVPVSEDAELLSLWSAQYMIDTGEAGAKGPEPRIAIARAVEAITGGKTRLLIEDGQPVAMTGFNAQLDDMVQVGGVFTPPDRRGNGNARRAVAAHLAEARAQGAKTAILFANNAAAARAYEAIGFERIGAYRVAILKTPQVIGGAA
ncbi:MAG: GNAT family N-acetyltransferase [Thalassovita sp.]|nr:GNAT family N-acetyltransferase [Thalassovita sp.]